MFFLACAAPKPEGPPPPAPEAAAEPVAGVPEALFPAPLRLGDSAIPRSYDLILRIDPAAPTFSGEGRIDVDLAAPTRLIRLHAADLTLTRAQAHIGERVIDLDAKAEGGDLALLAQAPLPAGRVVLQLAWQGPLTETPDGLYRAQEGGRWYAYTQFEPLEARSAFPCFDEPRFKTPYTLAIEVPNGLRAFANMPEREPDAGAQRDGALAGQAAPAMRRFAFETTPPLPSYLVAFTVGDFDVVEGPKVSGGRVPFRIITTKGKGGLAAFPLDKTPRYLDALEQWFGTPHPYPKLDIVAVPSFSSTAMENVGLITFREAVLLVDGDRASIDDRSWCEGVLAHELAHMWFGNLVTMKWWDDIWLNEAFATWMGRKMVQALSPELGVGEASLRGKYWVMHLDARANARAVRQPIASSGDVYNAFDGITYTKGAAILSMVEQWIGPEAFQAGVRSYLAAYAHGNASTLDLLAHLGREAKRDVAGVVASFVDQPGVPLVDLAWTCEADGAVTLKLTQTPVRLLGDERPGLESWRVPMCVRLSDGKHKIEHCDLLADKQATWRVDARFCPSFAHPNVDEAGYYRWHTTHGPISVARSDKSAFAGYVANLLAGVESGRLPLATLLDGVEPLFEASVSAEELEDLVTALAQVPRFSPEAYADPRFHRKAQALLARIPLDLGLGDSAGERRRMPTLVRSLGRLGRDKRVLAHAAKVAGAYLAEIEGARGGKDKISPEDAAIYLPLHVNGLGADARHAGARQALWARLRAAFDKARHPAERDLLIAALGAFDDAALVRKSYDLLLDGTLRAQDARTLREHKSPRPEIGEAGWRWLTERFEPIVAALGPKAAPNLPWLAAGFCDAEKASEVEAFFSAKKESLPSGYERPLALTLESIRGCVLGRTRYQAEARAWYGAR